MKIKDIDGLFRDEINEEEYYIDVTFLPTRVLAIYPENPVLNSDVTFLWIGDELKIQEFIDNGQWVIFE
jgi:hypothetical protein